MEISEKIVSQKGYLDNFNKIVEDMAKLPKNIALRCLLLWEPENIFGVKVASSWNQEILAKVKKYYKGKVFIKATYIKGKAII